MLFGVEPPSPGLGESEGDESEPPVEAPAPNPAPAATPASGRPRGDLDDVDSIAISDRFFASSACSLSFSLLRRRHTNRITRNKQNTNPAKAKIKMISHNGRPPKEEELEELVESVPNPCNPVLLRIINCEPVRPAPVDDEPEPVDEGPVDDAVGAGVGIPVAEEMVGRTSTWAGVIAEMYAAASEPPTTNDKV